MIHVVCPSCGGHMEAGSEFAGADVSCPHCETIVTLPKEAAREPKPKKMKRRQQTPKETPCPHPQPQPQPQAGLTVAQMERAVAKGVFFGLIAFSLFSGFVAVILAIMGS